MRTWHQPRTISRAHHQHGARRGLEGQRGPAGGERGLVLMAVLAMTTVLTLLGALAMFAAGREIALSGVRSQGAQSLYVAEGGALAARAALMAYLGVYPAGAATLDASLDGTTAGGWYASGANAAQNPFGFLDYIWIDGHQLTVGATPAMTSQTFQVNWALTTAHLKLQTNAGPANPLGIGTYTASVTLTPNPTDDPSCAGGPCAIHMLGPNYYEVFFNYAVTSIGSAGPKARREVTLQGSFSVQLHLQAFAVYALFTDTHTMSNGTPVWFTNTTTFNGPVHTNDEFRFLQFPVFTGTMESVNNNAWFYNNGHNIERAANSNVSHGVRIDAPLASGANSPQAAAPAAFTRGVPAIPLPTDPYNQQGVALGLNPGNTTPVTPGQIAAAVPELNGASSIPNGVYVPVTDSNGNCVSDSGEPMLGGIYVQGDVDSLTMSVSGSTAVYTFSQGGYTTTVTVDRANNQTTVTSDNWLTPSGLGCSASPGPATRTFTGVPKGYQGPGNSNGTMIYVDGSINSLGGTLQQNEQTNITAAGNITIQDNVLYQNPPNPSDPTSNPTNVLGLFTSGGNIVIGDSAPNNVTIDAILMAGSSGNYNPSQIQVGSYASGSPRGTATVLGGLIEKYYGPFGTVNGQGVQQTGYGRNFTYDTRMSRGFSPPYFPTTNQFVLNEGSSPMAGVKPVWREGTPP